MRNDLEVSKSIEVNAPPEKVWAALTTPDIIKDYLFGTETVTDWKVGNEIVFQGEYENTTYRDKGVILKNEPLQELSYSYWSGFSGVPDLPENYSTVTYKIEDKGNNKSVFTWIQSGFATEQGYEHSKSGMDEFMAGIKKVMER